MFWIDLNKKAKFTRPNLLHHPPIPPPMHGLNPRTILGKVWWDDVRRQAYERNNQCCWACGVHREDAKFYRRLEAHELYDIDYKRKRMKLREIVALCHACHNYVHMGRLRVLLAKGVISQRRYDAILAHGREVLARDKKGPWYNLEKSVKGAAKFDAKKDWKKWHLLLRGRKYFSNFKDEDHWKAYYAKVDR